MKREHGIALIAAVLVCAVPQASTAETAKPLISVQELRDMCKKPQSDPQAAFCLGFVVATGDLMAMNASQISGSPKDSKTHFWLSAAGLCAQGGAPSGGALTQAFLNWADKHPEKWGMNAQLGVMSALQDTWPC